MTARDTLAEIKRLYFAATKASIGRDFDRAIDLLKTLADDDEREKAAVYMEGLAQMRSEWGPTKGRSSGRSRGAPSGPRRG